MKSKRKDLEKRLQWLESYRERTGICISQELENGIQYCNMSKKDNPLPCEYLKKELYNGHYKCFYKKK